MDSEKMRPVGDYPWWNSVFCLLFSAVMSLIEQQDEDNWGILLGGCSSAQ